MEIRVSGHQVDTGDALRQHVDERMQALAEKFFSRSISAHVTFGHGPHASFCCDIVAHVMQGVILKGHGQASEAHPAFDRAADKIETQLRRYMRRLKDRHAGNGAVNGVTLADIRRRCRLHRVRSAAMPRRPADNPVIIAETRVDVPEASVSDAVMMLDLRDTGALLFRNSGTGAYNMVYRRNDGTIGWVEPQRAA